MRQRKHSQSDICVDETQISPNKRHYEWASAPVYAIKKGKYNTGSKRMLSQCKGSVSTVPLLPTIQSDFSSSFDSEDRFHNSESRCRRLERRMHASPIGSTNEIFVEDRMTQQLDTKVAQVSSYLSLRIPEEVIERKTQTEDREELTVPRNSANSFDVRQNHSYDESDIESAIALASLALSPTPKIDQDPLSLPHVENPGTNVTTSTEKYHTSFGCDLKAKKINALEQRDRCFSPSKPNTVDHDLWVKMAFEPPPPNGILSSAQRGEARLKKQVSWDDTQYYRQPDISNPENAHGQANGQKWARMTIFRRSMSDRRRIRRLPKKITARELVETESPSPRQKAVEVDRDLWTRLAFEPPPPEGIITTSKRQGGHAAPKKRVTWGGIQVKPPPSKRCFSTPETLRQTASW